MLIYSNEASGETVTFKFYDSETDTIYDISDTYEFIADMILGDATEPIVFDFDSTDFQVFHTLLNSEVKFCSSNPSAIVLIISPNPLGLSFSAIFLNRRFSYLSFIFLDIPT